MHTMQYDLNRHATQPLRNSFTRYIHISLDQFSRQIRNRHIRCSVTVSAINRDKLTKVLLQKIPAFGLFQWRGDHMPNISSDSAEGTSLPRALPQNSIWSVHLSPYQWSNSLSPSFINSSPSLSLSSNPFHFLPFP